MDSWQSAFESLKERDELVELAICDVGNLNENKTGKVKVSRWTGEEVPIKRTLNGDGKLICTYCKEELYKKSLRWPSRCILHIDTGNLYCSKKCVRAIFGKLCAYCGDLIPFHRRGSDFCCENCSRLDSHWTSD